MTVKTTVRIEGLREALNRLQNEVPREIAGKNGGPVLAALKKAGIPVKVQAQQNVSDDGIDPTRTKASIKMTRMRNPKKYVRNGEGIIIAPKRGRLSLKRFNELAAAAVAAGGTFMEALNKILKRDEAPWAGVQEFGAPSQNIPAQGFMRRASDAKLESAVKAFGTFIGPAIDKAMKRAGRGR